jgi:hypothetical protein
MVGFDLITYVSFFSLPQSPKVNSRSQTQEKRKSSIQPNALLPIYFHHTVCVTFLVTLLTFQKDSHQ